MRIAVLGMGHMGQALARRLLDHGHSVTVWNRTRGKAAEVLAAGATEAPGPAEAAGGAEVVLLSLAQDDAVLEVMGRLEGGAGTLAGTVVVDTSTVAPEISRTLHQELGPESLVSAPILGAPSAVRDGSALYLLGGSRAVVDRLEPLWASLSENRRWCGDDPGTATTLKILSNYLLLSGLATLGEAVATAQAAGLGDDLLEEFFGSAPLVAPALRNRLHDLIGGDHEGWFAARLGAKDAALVEQLAESAGRPLPLAAAVRERYEALVEAGYGDADIAAVVELARRPAGGRPGDR